MQRFGDQLTEQNDVINSLNNNCQDLLREGYISDSDPSLEQIWNLKRQHAKLTDKSSARASDLQQTKERLNDFYDVMRATAAQLDHVMGVCDAQKPVGGDVAAIKQQQADFKVGAWLVVSFCVMFNCDHKIKWYHSQGAMCLKVVRTDASVLLNGI